MDRPVITSGHVTRGKLKVRNSQRVARELQRWQDVECTITIEKKRATRSLAQNSLYWSVYVELLSEHTGYTPDEMHAYLKARFIPKKLAVCDGNGEIVDELVIGGTTTRLNKIEFGEFLRAIQVWSAEELGVVIPDPEEL